VYFYSRAAVLKHLNRAGFAVSEIQRVGKLYCVVATPEAAAPNTQNGRHHS
jgi:hypothetical protein